MSEWELEPVIRSFSYFVYTDLKKKAAADSFDIWDSDPKVGRQYVNGQKKDQSIVGYLNGKLTDRPAGGADYDYDYINGTWMKKIWKNYEMPPILTTEFNDQSAGWAYDFKLKQWHNTVTNKNWVAPKTISRADRSKYTYLGTTAYIPEKAYDNAGLHLAYSTRGWMNLDNSEVLTYSFKNDPHANVPGYGSHAAAPFVDPVATANATANNYLLVFGAVIGGITLMRLL